MGLSIYQNSEQAKAVRERFPSPLGEMGLSIKYVRWCIEHGFVSEFPSPLGEMGLSIISQFSELQESESFRPLSGKWGYRSSDSVRTALRKAIKFPSPLGEMGLSILREVGASVVITSQFPSPLGEMGLSIATHVHA